MLSQQSVQFICYICAVFLNFFIVCTCVCTRLCQSVTLHSKLYTFPVFVLQVWGIAHRSTPKRASPCGCVYVFPSGSALCEKTIYILHLQLRNIICIHWARPSEPGVLYFQLFPWPPSHPLQTLARQHFRTTNHEWILVVLQLLYRWAAAAGKPVVLCLQRHIHTTGNRKCSLVIEQHLCRSSTRFLFMQLYIRISHVCVLLLLFTAEGNMGGCQGDWVFFSPSFHQSSIIPGWGLSFIINDFATPPRSLRFQVPVCRHLPPRLIRFI